eukprot:6972420-Prymnesium_polylepis.1
MAVCDLSAESVCRVAAVRAAAFAARADFGSWRVARTPFAFPANVKPWPLEGLGAAHGYELCEKGSCEAAEQ